MLVLVAGNLFPGHHNEGPERMQRSMPQPRGRRPSSHLGLTITTITLILGWIALSCCAGGTTTNQIGDGHGDGYPSITPALEPGSSRQPAPGRTILLTVSNRSSFARQGDYVTSGVPLPRAWQVTQPGQLRVADSDGQDVPSQFRVASRWGGTPSDEKRPIMWAWATFPVDLGPDEAVEYRVIAAGSNDTAPGITAATGEGGRIEVDTGAARFTLDPTDPALLTQVVVAGMPVAAGRPEGLLCIEGEGEDRSVCNESNLSLWIEETGPLRITARAAGCLVLGDGTLDFDAWFTFLAGSSAVRILLTVGNHAKAAVNDQESTYDVFDYFGHNSVTFEGLRLGLELAAPRGPVQVTGPGADTAPESGSRTIACPGRYLAYQESSGTDYWARYARATNEPRLQSHVTFRGYRLFCADETLEQGDHHAGWFDVSDQDKGVAAGVRFFWQNFPMGLESDGRGGVAVLLLPADFPAVFNFRVGEEKTWELVLDFHLEDAASDGVASRMTALLDPLWALAEPDQYASDELGLPFQPFEGTVEDRMGLWNDPDPFVRHAYYIDRTLVADPGYGATGGYYYPFHSLWQSTPGHPSSTDYFDMYGWSWYGNQPIEQEAFGDGMSGPFDVKYNLDYGVWLQFLGSRDTRWRAMGEACTRHLEALMLHEVETETGWDVARWKNAIFGHSQHNETGNANSVRNHLGPVMDTAFGSRGSSLYYFLTGYRPSGRFVTSAAEYGYDFYKDVSSSSRPDFAPSREAGNLVNILTEGYRLAGDRKYQRLIQTIVSEFAAARQPYIHGPVPGSDVSIPTWIFALYYDAVARYAVLAEAAGLEEDAAFAKRQVIDYVRWHITYAVKEPEGWLTTYYYYRIDGNNDPSDPDMINNWTLLLADACAWAYLFSLEEGQDQDAARFLEAGGRFYETGTVNPFYLGSPLIYSASKESVNALSFGHVYAYVAAGGAVSPSFHVRAGLKPARTCAGFGPW